MQSVHAKQLPESSHSQRQLTALILVMLMVLAYLPALGAGATLVLAVSTAVAVGLISWLLSGRAATFPYLNMTLAMFALGGIGMLLGSALDFGPLALYGLLSLCQGLSVDLHNLAPYWQKLALSPWTYVCMLLGGNLGMWLFRRDNAPTQRSGSGLLRTMLVCNLGMLAGMMAGEVLVIPLVNISIQVLAMGLMVAVMLMTMCAGMLLALWCHDHLGRFMHDAQR